MRMNITKFKAGYSSKITIGLGLNDISVKQNQIHITKKTFCRMLS